MGFKTGLAIGGLATAVVALGIAVAILATDDEGDDEAAAVATDDSANEPTTGSEPELDQIPNFPADPTATCSSVESRSGPANINVVRGGATCQIAAPIFEAYIAAAPQRGTGSGAFLRVGPWTCHSMYNERPVLVECEHSNGFDLIRLEAAPQAPPAAAPGSCASTGAETNIVNLTVENMTCSEARTVISQFQGISANFAVAGFNCAQQSGTEFGGTWLCSQGGRAFAFDFAD